MRWSCGALVLWVSSCSAARLVGDPLRPPPPDAMPRVVLLEPFFEAADWQLTRRIEYVQGSAFADPWAFSGYPSVGSGTTAVERVVVEKPMLARVERLAEAHAKLRRLLQSWRPSWRMVSAREAPSLRGQVMVVRTVVGNTSTLESDRTLKHLAFGFGLVLLPLQIWAAQPVRETMRVHGWLERVSLEGQALAQRLVQYATQPEPAVSLNGLMPERQAFGLDISYEEGLLADEGPRRSVLVDGFVERLALAVVALVEEAVPPPPPVPAP